MTTLYMCIIICFVSINLGIDSPDFEKAFEEFKANFTKQWTQQTLKYDGPDTKVILTISNKVFHTSTNVLFNPKHGITFFIHEFLGTDKNSINHDSNCNAKTNEPDNDSNTLFKMDQAINDQMNRIHNEKKDKAIQLYFDRNPELFHYILDYLRGYPIEYDLYVLDVRILEKLLSDAKYFGLDELQNIVTNALHSRFNPYLCASSSLMQVLDAGRTLKRITGGLHISCSVYGKLETGTRYVEYDIMTHGNRYQMIGVTEADLFKSGPYPGHANVKGISLYGNNGHIYRNGGAEGWCSSFHHGDRVGVLVEITDDKKSAKITFYLNRKKVKHALDLKQYMNIDNGVLFTVNMHDAGEEVQIIQNPMLPDP
eukprot:56607_1